MLDCRRTTDCMLFFLVFPAKQYTIEGHLRTYDERDEVFRGSFVARRCDSRGGHDKRSRPSSCEPKLSRRLCTACSYLEVREYNLASFRKIQNSHDLSFRLHRLVHRTKSNSHSRLTSWWFASRAGSASFLPNRTYTCRTGRKPWVSSTRRCAGSGACTKTMC